MELGKKLKEERLRRKLSLRDAASRIGISHTYLSSLEKGYDVRSGAEITPSESVLLRICEAYELDASGIVPTVDMRNEGAWLVFAAKRIRALKKKDPRAYAGLLDIILGSENND